MRSHRVESHFHVLQCFKCQKFGHRAGSEQCPLKEEKKSVCLYCGGSHKSNECLLKKDKSKHRCVNCFEKGHDSVNHTSNSNIYPYFLRALQGVKNNTLSHLNQGN